MPMTEQPRFCDQCGKSLVPLSTLYVERPCELCGKTLCLAEPGEGGKGVAIRKGDKVFIPAGWLTLSLDPRKASGRFSRSGLAWFVSTLIIPQMPERTDSTSEALKTWESEADRILGASDKLKHLGNNVSDIRFEDAVSALESDKHSVEWWALLVSTFAHLAQERIASDKTTEAAYFVLRAAVAWAMLVFSRDLEAHVWTGYEHNQLVYDIASASARTPSEARVIHALQPIFENLSEDVLHVWIDSESAIGPKIDVTNVDESILRPLAKYHLSLFERRRRERDLDRDYRLRAWQHRLQGAGVVGGLAVAVATVLKAIGVL